jgi:hypothetical protein
MQKPKNGITGLGWATCFQGTLRLKLVSIVALKVRDFLKQPFAAPGNCAVSVLQATRIFGSYFTKRKGMFVTNDYPAGNSQDCSYMTLCGFPRLPAIGQCPQAVADSSS